MKPLRDRYLSKVVIADNPNSCWGWTGATLEAGHGKLRRGGSAPHIQAHRVSYELHVAPIPLGMLVLHKCDNPPCTNPKHLYLGTQAENMADKERRGRGNHKTANGHTLTPDQVREIFSLLEAGQMTHKQIGARFGIAKSTVTCINMGLSWTWLDHRAKKPKPRAKSQSSNRTRKILLS